MDPDGTDCDSHFVGEVYQGGRAVALDVVCNLFLGLPRHPVRPVTYPADVADDEPLVLGADYPPSAYSVTEGGVAGPLCPLLHRLYAQVQADVLTSDRSVLRHYPPYGG